MDHDTLRYVRSGVPFVAHGVGDLLVRPVPHMAVHLGREGERAVHGPCVRIEEQLRRVPAGTGPGVPAAVHPVAIPLTRPHARHEAVPDLMGQLGQHKACLAPVLVEEAELDGLRAARPEREIGARHPVGAHPEAGPERHRGAGPHGGRPPRHGLPRTLRHGLRPCLRHCLLLCCARHLLASRGSWGPAPRERAASRPRLPECGPPLCSAHAGARTHVSPDRPPSLGGREPRSEEGGGELGHRADMGRTARRRRP